MAENKMKDFSFGTILGFTLGMFLAGYIVVGYTPPTQTAPQGNTDTPLNTGLEDQTKQSGLWFNNGLVVDGGFRIGQSTAALRPVCDAITTKGGIIFDSTENRPYVCDGSIWHIYKGLRGDDGLSGVQGPQGPQGIQGIEGPQGPPG